MKTEGKKNIDLGKRKRDTIIAGRRVGRKVKTRHVEKKGATRDGWMDR